MNGMKLILGRELDDYDFTMNVSKKTNLGALFQLIKA